MDKIKFIGDLSKQDAAVLEFHARASKSILEFGAGGSTQIFSQCCPETLVSVETSGVWIEVTNRRIEELVVPHTMPVWAPYGAHPNKQYDLIFVDGIDEKRFDFALSTWKLLNSGGVMLFHDTRRERDARNVLNTASTYFSEVRSVSLNIDGSNTSVIRKGDPLPYVNWNHVEGLPMWRYGHDLTKSIHDIVD
jgi:predicted O-methyltransferase YrrM